jgi:hypothetical protein
MTRRRSRTQWRIRLIAIVGAFLAAVVIADEMGLTNHA